MTTEPNREDLAAYLEMVFGYVEDDDTCIALRGTGEKGTAAEGKFIEPMIVPGIGGQFDIDRIFGHVQRWSAHGHASFIVPAAMDAAALTDHKATEDRVRLLTTIVVDMDKGDTAAKLAHAGKHLGQPSMVVHSGGTTETGHPKLHAYWRLSEASDQIQAIAAARKSLALKLGGDPAFGRSTQVIRIPGSLYGKGGVQRPCRIEHMSKYEYELDELLAAITEMPVADGVTVDDAKLAPLFAPVSTFSGGGGLSFSGFKAAGGDRDTKPDIKLSLTTTIAEGGEDERNRWSEFNRVAGLHIHQARQGILTTAEARAHTETWMMAHMVPPWPAARFDSEWKALLAHDVKAKGPMPADRTPISQQNQQVIDVTPNGVGMLAVQPKLSDWAVSSWTQGEKPKRRFLVDGLILAGKAHMLAAEGGAGKTFLLLDLALKISTHSPDQEQEWCGLPLRDDAGGTVVVFTTEDDKDELHIRLSDIDPTGRRHRAGNRLVIIPTINIGGAFALVERERATGRALIGQAWGEWLGQLRQVPDLKLVVIDTLNTTLHGEENNATVINEYVQAAAAIVCGELGAALVVTHHVRKPGANVKIYTPDDMKNSIRGSTAIIGAFRVALGIWHAPDYKERLDRMGRDTHPGQLYNFAVVKANNPEMAFGTRAMLRQRSGLLVDITDSEKQMIASTQDETAAWLIKAVEYAAEKGHPFTVKGAMKKPPNGRKHQLPAMLASLSERKIQDLCERLLAKEDGRLVQCNPKGKTGYNYLDVPLGPLAKMMGQDGGAYRIAEGSDFEPPNWEHDFAFHPVEQRIVKRGEEASRTVGGRRQNTPQQAVPKGWNPNREAPVAPVAPPSNTPPATRATGLFFSPDCSMETEV